MASDLTLPLVTAERDRLRAILDVETGKVTPEGWIRIGPMRCRHHTGGIRAASSGGGEWRWVSLHYGDGTAPTLLEAIEAAEAALEGE